MILLFNIWDFPYNVTNTEILQDEKLKEKQIISAKKLFNIIENNGIQHLWNTLPHSNTIKIKIFREIFNQLIYIEKYEYCAKLKIHIINFIKQYPQYKELFKNLIEPQI